MLKKGTGFYLEEIIRKVIYRFFREPFIKSALGSCGENMHIAANSDIKGIENIYIKDDVSIGPNAVLWTTGADILIENKVMIGPNLTIITGNHRINVIGKYMADITAQEKEPSDDEDVIIEKDVWIGANVTILKGVRIGEGGVIAAGAVVNKSTEPFGIYGGVPAKKLGVRFEPKEIETHKNILNKKV